MLRQSQWEKDLNNAIRERDVEKTIELIRQHPNRQIHVITDTYSFQQKPLSLLLILFKFQPQLSQRDFEYIHQVFRFYCREFTASLHQMDSIPVLCFWEDRETALKFIKFLKRCHVSVDRQYGEGNEKYILWYLRQYTKYKKEVVENFDFDIFQELYVPRPLAQLDIRLVRQEMICLDFSNFKKCFQFFDARGMIDRSDNHIFEIYLQTCPKDTHFREKFNFLLDKGFHLPQGMILSICKYYTNLNKMVEFLQYVIEKGVNHDKRQMTIALHIIMGRSQEEPYQLLSKQKQQTSVQRRQSMRQCIRDEHAIHQIIKWLCENGANVETKHLGRNALEVAIRQKSREILNLLLYYMENPSPQKIQQVLKQFPTRSTIPKVQSMKQDVEKFQRFLSMQKLLSKRSFSNVDTAKQLSSYFTKHSRLT